MNKINDIVPYVEINIKIKIPVIMNSTYTSKGLSNFSINKIPIKPPTMLIIIDVTQNWLSIV